jgi:hypothetical protein
VLGKDGLLKKFVEGEECSADGRPEGAVGGGE